MDWEEVLAQEAVRWSTLVRSILAQFDPVYTLLIVALTLLAWQFLKIWREKGG